MLFRSLISVAEESQFVIRALRLAKSLSFRALVHDADQTMVIVARFLALLDLYRSGALRFEQLEAFTDLQISWIGTENGEILISDEFDQPVVIEDSERAEEAQDE